MHVDFPGVEGSSIRPHLQNLELYENTIDASAYWPLVMCPTLFISSSNDFHSAFERIYQSLALLAEKETTADRAERLLNLFSDLD